MKVLCLVCLNFIRHDWCMGYCNKKKHYIHKPLRNCSMYQEGPNVKDDPEGLMEWFSRACKLAWEKETMVRDFLMENSSLFKEKDQGSEGTETP